MADIAKSKERNRFLPFRRGNVSGPSLDVLQHRFVLFLPILLFGFPASTRAAVGGRISGTVEDDSGAVIPKATVTTTNTDTGARLLGST